MLQLLRFLIFGKQCQHEWKCDKSLFAYSNSEKHIYLCQKCEKLKSLVKHKVALTKENEKLRKMLIDNGLLKPAIKIDCSHNA